MALCSSRDMEPGQGDASMRARASAEARFSLRCARRPFPPLLSGASQAACTPHIHHEKQDCSVPLSDLSWERSADTLSPGFPCRNRTCPSQITQAQPIS